MYKYRFLLLIALAALSSCCKKKVYCKPGNLQVVFTGYNRLDVRTVIVKKYTLGNFSKALDSATFVYTGNAPVVLNKKDTLYLSDYSTTSTTLKTIYSGYDWDVRLPGSNSENYRLTWIQGVEHTFEMAKCSDHDASCIDDIGQFVCNGEWKGGNRLWIEKKK